MRVSESGGVIALLAKADARVFMGVEGAGLSDVHISIGCAGESFSEHLT